MLHAAEAGVVAADAATAVSPVSVTAASGEAVAAVLGPRSVIAAAASGVDPRPAIKRRAVLGAGGQAVTVIAVRSVARLHLVTSCPLISSPVCVGGGRGEGGCHCPRRQVHGLPPLGHVLPLDQLTCGRGGEVVRC